MNINVSFLLVPISDNIQTDLSPCCHSPSHTINTGLWLTAIPDRAKQHHRLISITCPKTHTIKVAPPLGASMRPESGLPLSAFGALLQQELHIGSECRLVKGERYLGFR